MGIVFRQSIKGAIVTLTGAALGAVLVFARQQLLHQENFGILNILINAGTILQLIAGLGTATMMQTFIQRYDKTDPRRGTLLGLTALVPLASTLLIALLMVIFRDPIIGSVRSEADRPLIRLYYYWIPVLTLLWSYCSWLEAFLGSQYRAAPAAFMREVLLKLGFLALTILLFFDQISPYTYISGSVLCFGLQLGGLLLTAARTEGFRLRLALHDFSRADYREMAHFSWYHLLAGSSFFIIGYADALMLVALAENKGLNLVAIYNMAIFFISLFTIPYRAMVAAAYPKLNETYIAGDRPGLQQLYRRSTINILIVSVAMALLLGLNMHNATAILRPEYASMPPIFFVLLLGRMAEVGSGPNAEVIGFSTYYKFIFRINLLLVLVLLALDFWLIPRYGAIGAAWATSISWTLFNIAKAIYAHRQLGLQSVSRASWTVAGAGLAVALGIMFIPRLLPPVPDAILRSALAMTLYGSLLLWLKPSEDLRVYLQSVRERKRLF